MTIQSSTFFSNYDHPHHDHPKVWSSPPWPSKVLPFFSQSWWSPPWPWASKGMIIPTMTTQRYDHHLHDHPKIWSSPPWPSKGLPSPSSWTPASSAPMSSDPVSHQSKQVDFFEQTFFAGPRFSFGLKKPFKKQKNTIAIQGSTLLLAKIVLCVFLRSGFSTSREIACADCTQVSKIESSSSS